MITKISASAGSGKTYCLTRRFLDLLFRSDPGLFSSSCAGRRADQPASLSEILAATFTNKAAAEMKSRVIRALKELALQEARGEIPAFDPNGAQCAGAGIWVERILRHYGSLNIRTIDSLLASLVRLSALPLGLSPDFTPSFDEREYFGPHYDALMQELAGAAPGAVFTVDPRTLLAGLDEACESLLYTGGGKGFAAGNKLRDLILSLVLRLLRDEEVPRVEGSAVRAALSLRHELFVGAAKALRARIDQDNLDANKNFLKYIDKCRAAILFRKAPDGVFSLRDDFEACLNAKAKGRATDGATSAFAAFAEARANYSRDLPLLREALRLAPLVALAHEIFARMQSANNENLLPAPCLPVLAARALDGESGVSDSLCRLGTRLSWLLLDEFQDTSREQWAAILPLAVESLAQGGSLTYVGDVKQAIYGWRGGDAALFDEAANETALTAVAGEPAYQRLDSNWRSHPLLVEFNNAFFSLLAEPETAGRVLAAMLPKDAPERFTLAAARAAAKIFSEVRQGIPPEKAPPEPDARAGARVVIVSGENRAAVEDAVQRRLRRLFLEELIPAWNCSDIAVLVRTGSEAELIAEWLTDFGLPVVTENSFRLSANPLVGRLISLLAFLDYPPDDLAFWEFAGGPEILGAAGLRGPDGPGGKGAGPGSPGVPEDWPARVALGRKKRPLYRLFREEFPRIWAAVEPFHNEAGLMSAYDTLREVIGRFDLKRRLPDQSPFLDRLLEVAHLAETRGHSSLAAFLSFWRECGEDEKLPLPENMDAVRIMTMHKAKGLEFPVVVLPFQHSARTREPELAVVELDGRPMLTRPGPELPRAYYPSVAASELERLNLLYVAWTRPISALYSFITRPANRETPLSSALEILLDEFFARHGSSLCSLEYVEGSAPDDGQTERSLAESGQKEAQAPAAVQEGAPATRRRPAFQEAWKPMQWLPRLKIHSNLNELAALKNTGEGASLLSPDRRGTFVHLCLERLALADEADADGRRAASHRAVRQAARLFPLPGSFSAGCSGAPDSAVDEFLRETEDSLNWFLSLPDALLWLSKGLREREIMDANGKILRVDLLVREPDGLLVIDYKTGRLFPGQDGRPEHLEQIENYMRLAGEAEKAPARGLIVYLDERRLIPVGERGNGAVAFGAKAGARP